MQSDASGRVHDRMNLVPMIDVLLVLLIIFIILQRRVLVDIPLSPAESAPPPDAGPPVVMELRADGSYAIDREAVPLERLESALIALYADRPEKALVIRTAPNRRYQEFVDAADLAKTAGVQVLSIMAP